MYRTFNVSYHTLYILCIYPVILICTLFFLVVCPKSEYSGTVLSKIRKNSTKKQKNARNSCIYEKKAVTLYPICKVYFTK